MSYTFCMYDKTSDNKDRSRIELNDGEKFIDHHNDRDLLDFEFDITYNYTSILDPLFDEALKAIYNRETNEVYSNFFIDKTGKYMEPIIVFMINRLGNEEPIEDYFVCTRGNCIVALKNLLDMCKMRPDGVFYVY